MVCARVGAGAASVAEGRARRGRAPGEAGRGGAEFDATARASPTGENPVVCLVVPEGMRRCECGIGTDGDSSAPERAAIFFLACHGWDWCRAEI